MNFTVSVPFRGISFPNPFCGGFCAFGLYVSVPFRGISFPNGMRIILCCMRVSVPFRGISFPNKYLVNFGFGENICFRPLPGHLISKFFYFVHDVSPFSFPSPSGASHFQITRNHIPINRTNSFPSPSGASHFQIGRT